MWAAGGAWAGGWRGWEKQVGIPLLPVCEGDEERATRGTSWLGCAEQHAREVAAGGGCVSVVGEGAQLAVRLQIQRYATDPDVQV
mgnify:CR=1 FL=1